MTKKYLFSSEKFAGLQCLGKAKGDTTSKFRTARKDYIRYNYYLDVARASPALLSEIKRLNGRYVRTSQLLGTGAEMSLLAEFRKCPDALITETLEK